MIKINKRQRKKQWKKYVGEYGRAGCEQCSGICNRYMKSSDEDGGWVLLTLRTYKDKNKWKLELRQKESINSMSEPIAYVEPKYCWNCGRKLK